VLELGITPHCWNWVPIEEGHRIPRSPQQPFQEQNERYNQRHKRKRQEQRMNGTGTRAHHFSSAAKNALNHRSPIRTKMASEQSSPNSEKSSRKIRELMKRSAGFMAKAFPMMRIVAR
jgi:hypothetical protein